MLVSTRTLSIAALACFQASLVFCEVVRRFALRRALLDAPNERSLHTLPTPRLGGVAIVAAMGGVAAAGWAVVPAKVRVLLGLSSVLAIVGLRDDVRPVSAVTRLTLQLALAISFLWWIGTPSLLVARDLTLPVPTGVASALFVVWIVGLLNIVNFMDGMDGLAGSQAVIAAVTLAVVFGTTSALAPLSIVLGAAALGFLMHNVPPARIFMGDAGSTFIGMLFASLAVLGMHEGVPITETALPLAPFLLDGTFTLARRALRGERIWQAHRTHLYQRAVQAGLGHREVLLVYVGWMALAAGCAILASRGRLALGAGWIAMLVTLVAVWRWVVWLERSERSRRA